MANQSTTTLPTKKVHMGLAGVDGNAFFVMGAWARKARDQKWTEEEIRAVLDEAKSGDYEHLLGTIAEFCTNPCGRYRR